MEKSFDVFLSHSHDDAEIVEAIARKLEDVANLRVWLDRWILVPGKEWQHDMAKGISEAKSFAVFIGSSTPQGWFDQEIQRALNRQARDKTFRVIPVLLPGSDTSFVDNFLELRTWVDFREGLENEYEFHKLISGIKNEKPGRDPSKKSAPLLGEKFNIPELPLHFLERSPYLNQVKSYILGNETGQVSITNTRKIGFQGMGGIGKSVLETALARDNEIQKAFPDGIFWLTIGQNPNIIARQRQLAEVMGELDLVIDDPQQGKAFLEKIFSNRRCLLILDDIWKQNHVEHFNFLRRNSCLLVTTRNKKILRSINAEIFFINLLDPDQALELLANWAGKDRKDLPEIADQVAQECGYLPLALAVVGALVKHNSDSWERALFRLQNANLDKLKSQFPDYPYENLLAALEASVLALPTDIKPYYESLAIFPEGTSIPEQILQIFWEIEKYDVQDITDTFVARSLAQRDNELIETYC